MRTDIPHIYIYIYIHTYIYSHTHNKMEQQEQMSSIFFEGNPINIIKSKFSIDMVYELCCLQQYLRAIIAGKIDAKHLIDFHKKLTILHARNTLENLSPDPHLEKCLHHLDLTIRLWSFSTTSKWMNQLSSCTTFIDDFLQQSPHPPKP